MPYAITGRFDIPMANSLALAFLFEAPEIPDLTKLQQGLMDVFQYELLEED